MKLFPKLQALALIAAVGVQASAWADVTALPEQVAQVKVGLTAEQVQAALGRPATDRRYPLSGARVWTYVIPGGREELEVSFGPDGRVVSVRAAALNNVP